jgi:hypothetical protein
MVRPLHILAAASLTALLFSGCADQSKVDEVELLQLLGALPGTYDTNAQADEDARTGAKPPHDRITLVITRVTAPRIGHHVHYVQEMAPDDPNRVESQHLYSFKTDETHGGIVQTIYTFVEPLRWRDGQKNTAVFFSLAKDDLESVPGCEVNWHKGPPTPPGQKPDKAAIKRADFFRGAVDAAKCHPPGSQHLPPDMKLTETSLTIGDYQFRKIRN